MALTLVTLRQGLSEEIGDWLTETSDSAGTSTTVICSDLAGYPDDTFNDQWLLITSGTYAGEKRRISDFTQTTGTITFLVALAGSSEDAKTFEIHKTDPDDKKRALNEARLNCYPYLHQNYDDRTVLTHASQHEYGIPTALISLRQIELGNWVSPDLERNILSNGDFEDWTGSSPDDWTATDVTTAQESEDYFVLSGDYSCQCLATLDTAGYHLQSISSPSNYAGMRLSLSIWVYCLTGSRLRATIKDGSTYTYGDYHNGRGWEKLTVSADMSYTPASLDVGITCASGAVITWYEDDAILWIGRRVADVAGDPLYNWTVRGSVLLFPYQLSNGRPLRLIGMGYLSSVSADTDEMEIDAYQARLLYAEAARLLHVQKRHTMTTQAQAAYNALLNYWEVKVLGLKARAGMPIPALKKNIPNWGT